MDLIPLSWSRLSAYRLCPAQFKAMYISKDYPFDDDNPAFSKGKAIHKQLEDYILWKTDNSDDDMPTMGGPATNAKPIVDKLFDLCGVVYPEKQIALDQDWNKCDWFDTPSVVKFRAVIDALAFHKDTLTVIDFKSGKVRPYEDDYGQLHLTAAMMLSLYPNITTVSCHYLFVEHKKTITIEIYRDQLGSLKDQFNGEHVQVSMDKDMSPSKNRYCHFCKIKEDCIYG